jgi:hypothetical protein
MKTVRELNQDELNELKQNYATARAEEAGEQLSYGELADSVNIISNEIMFVHHEGMSFVKDDFFCNISN